MNLFLLRHGLAVERGARGIRDADRPLTPKGRKKVHAVANAIARMEIFFDLILTSPLLRARSTALIVAKVLECDDKLERTELLAPGTDPRAVVEFLIDRAPPPQNVLVVGHEPDLSSLASLLLTGGYELGLELKKAGVCGLDIEKLRPGKCAILQCLLTPSHLLAMN